MKAICTKDVVFMDRVVFEEGQLYRFVEDNTGGVEGYTVKTPLGNGFFSKKDKTLKKHFKKEGDFGFAKLEEAWAMRKAGIGEEEDY
jgi:hypothetical protein